MKKCKLENALYQVVIIKLKDTDNIYKGYLVRDRYNLKRYSILPLDISQSVISFAASLVQEYTFLNNGEVIK